MLAAGKAEKKKRLLQEIDATIKASGGHVPSKEKQKEAYANWYRSMWRLDRIRRKQGEEAFLKELRKKKIKPEPPI